MPANPLILTLSLNPEAQAYFNQLREKYFPPERNFLQAHLTLFHHLPQSDPVQELIGFTAANQPKMCLAVTGLRSLGRGVAFHLESPELTQLHRQLQQKWQPFLTPQDRQPLRPHITVQNKVSPEEAKQLLASLSTEFQAFEITGTGFSLWEYLGGPWRLVQEFPFR